MNLFFKYDVPGDSPVLRDLSFTLNVNNVFDQDPPNLAAGSLPGERIGQRLILGRMFVLRAPKKF